MSASEQLRWRLALCNSALDAIAKLVGLVLDTYADKQGRCWPSRESIARRAGLSVRGVALALARLEAAGFLVVQHSKGRHSNRYQLVIPEQAAVMPVEQGTTFPVNKAPRSPFNQAPDDGNQTPDDSEPGTTFPRSRKEAVNKSKPPPVERRTAEQKEQDRQASLAAMRQARNHILGDVGYTPTDTTPDNGGTTTAGIVCQECGRGFRARNHLTSHLMHTHGHRRRSDYGTWVYEP